MEIRCSWRAISELAGEPRAYITGKQDVNGRTERPRCVRRAVFLTCDACVENSGEPVPQGYFAAHARDARTAKGEEVPGRLGRRAEPDCRAADTRIEVVECQSPRQSIPGLEGTRL